MSLFRFSPSTAAVSMALFAGTASATPLNVGDAAPPLSVGRWLKGEPVGSFDRDTIYVVDFWATWCAPCKAFMPHLTELQAKYPKIVFIGQDVMEVDKAAAKVEPFVRSMGDKIGYRIALDDRSSDAAGAMATGWLHAAGYDGLPVAFVVNKGATIAWIGPPRDLEPVLEQLSNGTFDPVTAKRAAQEQAARDAANEQVQEEFRMTVGPLLEAKDYAAAAKAIDELAGKHPDQRSQLRGAEFGMLLRGKQYDAAYQVADAIALEDDANAAALNVLAWTLVDDKSIEQRDYDRAERYALRAAAITQGKDPVVLETLARVYADKGEVAKAVKTQSNAIAAAVDEDGQRKAKMNQTLESYRTKQPK